MDIKNSIFKLSNAFGVSGQEYQTAKIAMEIVAPFADETFVDVLGNCVAYRKCGKPNAPKIMLDAHLDEVGFLVTDITEEGFLRFHTLSVDPRMLPGAEIEIFTQRGMVDGIIATIPPHLQERGEQEKALPADSLVIDIGYPFSKAKELVSIGDFAHFKMTAFEMRNEHLVGKAFDDRACFICLAHALELLKDKDLDIDIVLVGSTKEEVGGHGAVSRAYKDKPDFAIIVDVCHAKTPDSSNVRFNFDKGGVLSIGPNSSPLFASKFMEIAKEKKIPYQISVETGHTGTNAWGVQVVREGIPTVVLSMPLKYMHGPLETIKLADIKSTAKLISEFCLNFPKELLGGQL